MSLHIVILAAGQGKRMRSATPKVLHKIAGKSMLERVVETAGQLKPAGIHVIIGHGGDIIQKTLPDLPVQWVVQEQQLGTGHAVLQALPNIPAESMILILSADVPLIGSETLERLLSKSEEANSLALLVAKVSNPEGLGRIVRDKDNQICAIVEEKDASEKQKEINEIYSGICSAPVSAFKRWLPRLNNNNAQGEYYLTEIIQMAVAESCPITAKRTEDALEIQGVNNRLQLHQLERSLQKQFAEHLMLNGVTVADADRIDVRGELVCEEDVYLDVNTVFEGTVSLGKGSTVGPNCVLKNVSIASQCEIKAHSILEDCVIGDACEIGPFARIRPGTILAARCKIGNFVEAKKAVLGEGSKASHLSYLGDVTIGKEVNVGAGTITCNYDGVNKHQTIIEDGAFIGSDTQLVAPVTIGENATIGAGSTIRKNAPPGELTLTESKQKTMYGWKRPVRNK